MSDTTSEAVYRALLMLLQREPRALAAEQLLRWLEQDGYSIIPTAELDKLREAIAYIQEVCKPMSMTMEGPVWFDGGTPAGGGSRERIWRICREALGEQP